MLTTATTTTTFSEELEQNIYEPWRFQYVSYEAIQRDMQRRQDQGWTRNDEADFERTIRLEAEKVDQFITRKQREIDSRVAYCERTLIQQRQTSAGTKQMYDAMGEALTDILIDLNDLSKYTRYNFLALTKLIKSHDESTNTNRQQLLVEISRSKQQPLDRQRFDTTLVKISTLHDICRLYGETRTGNAAAGADQNAFERATAKYWVHPDNVTELKAILLFHLPVLVFNPNKPVEASDSAISSVYFDNDDYDLYSGRLERDEGAEAIRFRWYGPMESRDIFIERKTHHAPWLDGVSVKDRFRMDVDKVDDFISQRYTAEQYVSELRQKNTDSAVIDQNKFIFTGVQKSIREKRLSPIMRVFYNRTAFQIPGDQRLRVSLDTDLTFVREDMDRRKGSWRRPDMGIDHPFRNLPEDDVYHFPYAVLETKLQTHLGQEPPEWLSRLLDSRLVYEVPRFSKYLHGAAHFWKPRLPLLPWWLSELELDIRNAKQPSAGGNDFTGLSRSKSLKPLIDGRYRMGYLEKQLEKRATIKRQASKSAQQQQQPRGYAAGGMVTGTIPSSKQQQDGAHVVQVNPFDDPIWNSSEPPMLDFERNSQASRSYNNIGSNGVRNRSSNYLTSSDTQRNGFVDSSSTDHLMIEQQQRATPRSMSIMDNSVVADNPTSYSNYNMDNRTIVQARDSAMIKDEFSNDNPTSEKKKKKKNKDKDQVERLEPKIFFANERTFINWLQFAALILTAALMLLNFGDGVSKIAGATFFGISMVLALYAFGRYRYRAWQITNRPRIRYDDIYGPIGLCILVVGALIVNFVLRMQQPPSSSTYLGINNQTQQQT
ncbi:VTC domain-containing protein [Zychaea mexicana]|uniref:VTC domain-containing protein n=1 Tax=Zychaea mexicana TaxID=64656 RepID=UPI0022FE7883|nr:VTC domain-containing protein [Zychaea mexicana]KAI9498719.1 VTC domain-containing protein [Zychaea mexicana]